MGILLRTLIWFALGILCILYGILVRAVGSGTAFFLVWLTLGVLLLLCGNKCAVRKRPEKGLLAGLWELPNDEETAVPEGAEFCGEAVHIFSHVEWHMKGHILRVDKELPGYVWVDRAERQTKAIPSAFRSYVKILEQLGY